MLSLRLYLSPASPSRHVHFHLRPRGELAHHLIFSYLFVARLPLFWFAAFCYLAFVVPCQLRPVPCAPLLVLSFGVRPPRPSPFPLYPPSPLPHQPPDRAAATPRRLNPKRSRPAGCFSGCRKFPSSIAAECTRQLSPQPAQEAFAKLTARPPTRTIEANERPRLHEDAVAPRTDRARQEPEQSDRQMPAHPSNEKPPSRITVAQAHGAHGPQPVSFCSHNSRSRCRRTPAPTRAVSPAISPVSPVVSPSGHHAPSTLPAPAHHSVNTINRRAHVRTPRSIASYLLTACPSAPRDVLQPSPPCLAHSPPTLRPACH